MKTINKKHKTGDVHISDHLPPGKAGGARWVRVFSAGAGEDHVVSAKRKASYSKRARRVANAARREAKSKPAPQFATRWNLAFFDPAKMQP